MAARVQVIVEAKDSASGILRGITSQFGTFGQAIEEVTGKNVSWGNLAAKATELVVNGLKESVKATQEYAAEVRDLSLASGASAEEASRLLQVLDDFEISAQDVTLATKALTKNGLAPTVETIAELADKYVALNTPMEKNQFIIDNLGRGGLKWANALSQGGAAIRELNSGVNENLILTEQNIIASENYRLAIDNWNDSVQGLKISIGNELLPVLTQLMEGTNAYIGLANQQESTYLRSAIAIRAIEAAALQSASSADSATVSYTAMAQAFEQAGGAAANATTNFASQLSMMERLNKATEQQIKLAAYQDLKQQLSEGGIDESEAALLERAGIALGIFDKGAANAAKSISALNAQLASGQVNLSTYVALLNQIPKTINTTVTTTYKEQHVTSGPLAGGQASGGTVYAGNPYIVGEQGREPFIPEQNGRILGHAESLHAMGLGGGGGTNYFYGNVTLSIDEESAGGILGYR